MIGTGPHSLSVEDRKRLVAEGVRQVNTFTDKEIQAETVLGHMVLKGTGLNITDLNLESGRLVVEGTLQSISYLDERTPARRSLGRGIWERLIR
ncbi:MAG TPA: sporulation protein YabP [Desulfotomaculum sp.]|nr:sporulation protein YabP [Desulfotomaculum sp.]